MNITYWIISLTLDQYFKNTGKKKKVQEFSTSQKKKVQRMNKGDQFIYYLNDKNKFIAISELRSEDFEVITEETLVIKIRKVTSLSLTNCVDADQIGPRLEYVKRWVPERWRLAMVGSLHIISRNDYDLIRSSIDSHNIS
tara:strand:+ start:486 stop:905 length:420 start_codon:yes stop_codon:yes gene_type:complete